jgi:hypothetical protein
MIRALSVLHGCRLAGLLALLFAIGCGGSSSPAKAPASEAAPPAPQAPQDTPGEAADQSPTGGSFSGSGHAPANEAEESAPSSLDRDKSARPEGEFDALTRQLDGALALSTPNCGVAWSLRDRICDLANRICDMAARSAEPEVTERCTDGRVRCERATARVRSSCQD